MQYPSKQHPAEIHGCEPGYGVDECEFGAEREEGEAAQEVDLVFGSGGETALVGEDEESLVGEQKEGEGGKERKQGER